MFSVLANNYPFNRRFSHASSPVLKIKMSRFSIQRQTLLWRPTHCSTCQQMNNFPNEIPSICKVESLIAKLVTSLAVDKVAMKRDANIIANWDFTAVISWAMSSRSTAIKLGERHTRRLSTNFLSRSLETLELLC